MRHLLNTLYVFTEDAYLMLDGENVVVRRDGAELGRVPLHTLEGILCFSYRGASPALMGACVERGVGLSFFDRKGRFLAGAYGEQRGNVLLRKTQYAWSEDTEKSLAIARNFIVGKLYNGRWVLERAVRDHGLRIDTGSVKATSMRLDGSLRSAAECETMDSLRGIEGDAAAEYFGVFDELVLRDRETFRFTGRARRPPTDAMNAMLSLFYTVLAFDCASALEGVGLDPFVGFMHADRPGRRSLALDLMEELRPVLADRFVLTLINRKMVNKKDFSRKEDGAVIMGDEARKLLLSEWQNKKKEMITHPYLNEKVEWGMIPFVQAMLLSRYLRGDIDEYPPFFWK